MVNHIVWLFQADIPKKARWLVSKFNKKVLLRECKRHTARHVASTLYVVLTVYPPPSQGTPRPGYPPSQGTPPARVPPPAGPARVPPGQGTPPPAGPARVPPPAGPARVPPPAAPWHSGKCCKALWDMGTPPLWTDRLMDGWMDGWMDGQTHVKTLPSRRTTYAGGNKPWNKYWFRWHGFYCDHCSV